MNIYTIRYISGKTLQPCFDSQMAHNLLSAYDAHKSYFPHSRHVEIRRHSDGRWFPIGSDAI